MPRVPRLSRLPRFEIAKSAETAKVAETAGIANNTETEIAKIHETFKKWVIFGEIDGFFEETLILNQNR